ncbi:D-glycero-beta-D-manno-heptose 1,7-bisphosphate 7-phosphatase [Thiorhodococcus minor]|uniref:D,D-heptose 1,7-bisphosphate phosphatase n=1 Tax=Thiorhodococcus minor TaxID=57489 RepID=A0A6M0K4Y6_9GAMM|nr:D-glycero-beta-D-manno-heptose 1,7-bisphosphate 7-phosphatase [Thiorhodococcus minor]
MRQPPSSAGRLVILDRDGVINHDSDTYVKSVGEWTPIPGSIDAITRLSRSGYRVAVATNQSGLARSLFTHAELNAIHRQLHALLATQGGKIELIAFCPHGPDAGCRCRKPGPGLLEEIAGRFGCCLESVPFIGDSISDVRAARAAGASPWLVRTGKGERTLAGSRGRELADVPIFADLGAAAHALLTDQGYL